MTTAHLGTLPTSPCELSNERRSRGKFGATRP